MATRSGILTWETPQTEESGRLQLQGGLKEPNTMRMRARTHALSGHAC